MLGFILFAYFWYFSLLHNRPPVNYSTISFSFQYKFLKLFSWVSHIFYSQLISINAKQTADATNVISFATQNTKQTNKQTKNWHAHTNTYVWSPACLSLSVGSLSVLTGCGPGLTTDRQNQGEEETPGSAKRHGWTALQGPGVWESPVWHPWKQIKYTAITIWKAPFWFHHFGSLCGLNNNS